MAIQIKLPVKGKIIARNKEVIPEYQKKEKNDQGEIVNVIVKGKPFQHLRVEMGEGFSTSHIDVKDYDLNRVYSDDFQFPCILTCKYSDFKKEIEPIWTIDTDAVSTMQQYRTVKPTEMKKVG